MIIPNSVYFDKRWRGAVLLLSACLALEGSLFGATYYIDFAGGSDNNTGTAAEAAFKHCPGDTNAVGNAASARIQPGDTMLFKGGVRYAGSIKAVQSGTESDPVTYDGNTAGTYGVGPAIVDGSEPVTGWQACASAADCNGNSNWPHILTAWVPETVEPWTANLREGDGILGLAQTPNLNDFDFVEDMSTYWTIATNQITPTSITDPVNLTQTNSGAYDGAYALVWAGANWIHYQTISAFDPVAHQITFPRIKAGVYKDRPSVYAIANALSALDRPGEFVVSLERDSQKRRKVYLWPFAAGGEPEVTVSVRGTGFNIDGKSHVIFQGFVVQKQSGFSPAAFYNRNIAATGVVVRCNVVRWLKATDSTGAINLNTMRQSQVVSNLVVENNHCRGFLLCGFNDSTAAYNVLRRNGGTGITFFGCHRSSMIGNQVSETLSVHGNGLTAYLSSSDIFIAYNKVWDSNVTLTTQQSTNITVAYNILVGQADFYAVADWSQSQGVKYFNNVMMYKGKPKKRDMTALVTGRTTTDVVLKNNILYGFAYGGPGKPETGNNLYVALNWCQKEDTLGPGDKVVRDLDLIFRDPGVGDYRLKPGSPAIGAGVNVGLERDFAGVSIPRGKAPDVGAYQFVP